MKNVQEATAELIAKQFDVEPLEARLEMSGGPYGRNEIEVQYPDVPIEEGC